MTEVIWVDLWRQAAVTEEDLLMDFDGTLLVL